MSVDAQRSQTTGDADRPPAWPAFVAVAALASLPYLTLLAANVGETVDLPQVAVWWAATLGIGLAVVALARRWAGHEGARRVATTTAVLLYLVFNYPLVTSLRETTGVRMPDLLWWAVVTLVVLAASVVLARRPGVQRFVAVLAPVLLLAPLFQLVTAEPADARSFTTESAAARFERTPNVYWFVLDAFAGPVYLEEELQVETDPFVEFLTGRGFRVPLGSRTNYPFTHLAVTSALQLEYVYEGVEEPATGPFAPILRGDSRTVDTFRANGYGYLHAYSGIWSGSRCGGSEDVCLGDEAPLSDTLWALASATPLIDVLEDEETNATIAAGNDPSEVVDRVLASAPPSPYFAMIHLMNPHTPFLRDAACAVRDIPLSFEAWRDGPEYADAVRCLFTQLRGAVDRILEADPDAVILIQGDHGPRLGLGPHTSGEVLLDDPMFFSAFSAMRLPAGCEDTVPEDVTLVNTFRLVFACLADEEPDLLEDRFFPIRRDYD